MISQFYVPEDKYETVKAMVRKYDSFRLEQEPYIINKYWYFYVSGDVEQFNIFHSEIERLFRPEVNGKKSVWERILRFFGVK
jgi:hypothetical protein